MKLSKAVILEVVFEIEFKTKVMPNEENQTNTPSLFIWKYKVKSKEVMI